MDVAEARTEISTILDECNTQGSKMFSILHGYGEEEFIYRMENKMWSILVEINDRQYRCIEFYVLQSAISRFMENLSDSAARDQFLLSVGIRPESKEFGSVAKRVRVRTHQKPKGKMAEADTIQMNGFDRWMAVLRTETYIKDYAKRKRVRDENDASAEAEQIAHMERKYGFYPTKGFTPDVLHLKGRPYEAARQAIREKCPDLRLINGDFPLSAYDGSPIRWLIQQPDMDKCEPFTLITRHRGRPIGSNKTFEKYTKGKAGRYLYLRIDLEAKEKAIKDHVSHLVKYAQGAIPKKTGRNRSTTVNPWLAYDVRHNGCSNDLEATRVLFNGNEAGYKQVAKAIEKAEKMIALVEKALS